MTNEASPSTIDVVRRRLGRRHRISPDEMRSLLVGLAEEAAIDLFEQLPAAHVRMEPGLYRRLRRPLVANLSKLTPSLI